MNGTTYGYVRVSTVEQNVDRQVIKMESLGVDPSNIIIDKASGKNLDREGWKSLNAKVKAGDSIILDSLDRLGRDYDDITEEWRRLTRDEGVAIRCLDLEFFDSENFKAMGDLGVCLEDMLLSLLAYVAQTERKKMKQRQAEGIAAAKARGVQLGRKTVDIDQMMLESLVAREKAGEVSTRRAAELLGVSARTYRRRRDAILAG